MPRPLLALPFVLLCVACCRSTTGEATPSDSAATRPTRPASAPASADAGSTARGGAAATTTPAAAGAVKTLRVYVAGESIERRNRWVEAPFTASGALNERGGGAARNDDDEYGWMVPFAERLRLRDPGLRVEWVGTDAWLDAEDNPYSGKYPPGPPGRTSAVSGTSIDSWLEQRRAELVAKRFCYDLAFASRGGNDFGLDDDAAVGASLEQLVRALLAGSKCRPSPIVVVTGHMPDDQRGGGGPSDRAYVGQQRARFVERFRGVVARMRSERPEARVRFVDLYTPFVESRPTAAFPREAWSRGGVPDYAKIGRDGDRMHPRRLASIYAGEIAADSLDLTELRQML
jgi:hypothetical protein